MATETFLDDSAGVLHKGAMSVPLGNAIKAARLRKKMTQSKLAEELGITRAAVGQWEAGTNEPSAQNLFKISDILDLDLSPASQVALREERRKDAERERDIHTSINKTESFDIPVTHVVLDEDGLVFSSIQGGAFAYVRRFPFFDRSPNIFAMVFSSNVLSPKYEQNDVVYVDPDAKPAIGEYGIFKFKDIFGSGITRQIARRVLFMDDVRVILSRLKPDRQDEWQLEDIEEMGRIIPEWELVRSNGKADLP